MRKNQTATPADEGMAAAKKEDISKEDKLRSIRLYLEEIQGNIDQIVKLDPYGDMDENFKDSDGTWITEKLIDLIESALIDEDLKRKKRNQLRNLNERQLRILAQAYEEGKGFAEAFDIALTYK